LKNWAVTVLKFFWGTYFILTSVYCLLAYLPYTYYALIKAPAYEWMPWFVRHHAALYWLVLAGAAVAYWPGRKSRWYLLLFGALAMTGIYVTVRPFMAALQSDGLAYAWSLLALLPLIGLAMTDVAHRPRASGQEHDGSLLAYSGGVFVAIIVALLYVVSVQVRTYAETRSVSFQLGDLELTAWSVISHVLLAILVLTLLNLVRVVAMKTRRPSVVRLALTGLLVFAGLWMALLRFLGNALSFEGRPAHLYAATLAAGLTLFALSIASPWLAGPKTRPESTGRGRRLWLFATAGLLAVLALTVPSMIRNSDWNGVLASTFTLAFWLALGICAYGLQPRWRKYSVATILAVFLLSGFTYKALQASAIFWGKPLGSTDDAIARTMENYAAQDASFQLAHQLLGNAREEHCADLCRILREYTNIRDAQARTDVKLVDSLIPAQGERPNIFIFVIDSLRPDYLGAYNPRVDFTPNLDAFAKDKNTIALRNAYTQYAGTTLSEPAIWSGVMLLHTHYLQPFHRVNGLEKLANADGYQMMVSYDTVLSQLLSPSDDIVKLDTDKPLWNRFEVCSTVQQTEQALDTRSDKTRPVLFYAQPMNVHQFAHNNLPMMTSANWRLRPGFHNRIAYEVHQVDEYMGSFFAYLKSRGMYDNSIIVLISDHGDATGEYGRFSHSVTLFPEVMRVPMIVHLPPEMRKKIVYDDSRVSLLTDVTPSLYYLLGHRPVVQNPLFGRPLFAETKDELQKYSRDEVFLASDVRAAYGILADNGRFLYFTYDSPPESFLYDLAADPNGEHNVVTDAQKKYYDQHIIEHLQAVADFYGYKPGVGSLLASAGH